MQYSANMVNSEEPYREVEAVRVERVVGGEGVHQEPLEAAEVLGHELGLRVAAEPGRQLLLQPLRTVAVSVGCAISFY